ncbi:MAG: CZB domain-containing protein [Clostridiales bacterium]|nr:CZB domain-containing protein [Clostridiales bacterium]
MKNFMANINNESYTLANHERCSFGMWYEDNVMEYGDIQEFAAVYDVHKKFHDLASSYKSTKNSKYVLEMVETAIEVLSALLALGTKFTEMMESGAV